MMVLVLVVVTMASLVSSITRNTREAVDTSAHLHLFTGNELQAIPVKWKLLYS